MPGRGHADVAVWRCEWPDSLGMALVRLWSCGLCVPGAVGPCGGFVVGAAVLDASVQDAGEAAGDAAQRVVVAGAAGAELVVVGAGSGGCADGGERLGVQGVDEVPVADVPGVYGLFLAGGDGQRGGSGVVLAGLGGGVAAGGVAELAEDAGAGDVPDAGLGQIEAGIGVTSKSSLTLASMILACSLSAVMTAAPACTEAA